MSCYQQCCVAVGFVRGEAQGSSRALKGTGQVCSQKNIEELSLLLIGIRKMLVSRGRLGFDALFS